MSECIGFKAGIRAFRSYSLLRRSMGATREMHGKKPAIQTTSMPYSEASK